MQSRAQRMVRVLCWLVLFLPTLAGLVIGGLVAFASHSLNHYYGPAHRRAALGHAVRLEMYVDSFRLDCGRLPDSLDELFGVVRESDCVTNAPRQSDLIDPYGNPYVYWRAADGSRYEVRSLGRDRVYASADDVYAFIWDWPWPRPWHERVDWPRLIGALLLVLLVAAIAARLFAAVGSGLRIAWRRWHTPMRKP